MITVRTPLRVSFFGGGSDLPAYYNEHGGAVLSTSIDKSIYVSVNKKFDDTIRLSYSKTEIVPSIEDLKHTLAKEILQYLKIDKGIEIVSIADIPSEGTGLGSSSTYTVAMLHALYSYKNMPVTKEQLSNEACIIEIEKHKQPIGKQDQYAAAYGGLNLIEFNQDDSVSVQKVVCLKETKQRLQDNLLMMYTGTTRSASGILQEQSANMNQKDKIAGMKRMVELAYIAKKQLEENNLNDFGKLLHEGWMLKKEMSGGITNPTIDNQYERALKAGAHGGKILGAGGGGFLLLYAPKELHSDIEKALSEMREVPFSFDHEGSKVLYYY